MMNEGFLAPTRNLDADPGARPQLRAQRSARTQSESHE
jgi:hypothetical protein